MDWYDTPYYPEYECTECGAEASYLSDELCGSCLEHAVFNEIEE